MQNFNTRAFVLKYHSFGTSHKVIILFAFDLGKIKSIIYGAHKNPHKGTTFEILNQVQLNLLKTLRSDFYQTLNFELITSSRNSKFPLSFEILQNFYFIGELLNLLIQEEDPHNTIFLNLERCILNILKEPPFFKIYLLSFRLKTLYLLGFLPIFQKCYICKNIPQKSNPVYLEFKEFKIYCFPCIQDMKNKYLLANTFKLDYNVYENFLALYEEQLFLDDAFLKKKILLQANLFEGILKKIEAIILDKKFHLDILL